MPIQTRLVALLSLWLGRLPVTAGLGDLARKWEAAASAWEETTGRPVDQSWLDAALHDACRAGHPSGRDLAWVVAYASLIGERGSQGEGFATREVELLRAESVAAVLARQPEGAFARARQAGKDRGRRPVPRCARSRSL